MTIIDVESIIQELNNIDLSKDYTKKSFMKIVTEKCKNNTKKKNMHKKIKNSKKKHKEIKKSKKMHKKIKKSKNTQKNKEIKKI